MKTEKLRVLVVDDDMDWVEDFLPCLVKAGPLALTGEEWTGLEICHVTNQADADRLIAGQQFHIVLLDLLYPAKVEPGMELPLLMDTAPRDRQGEVVFQGMQWLPILRSQLPKAAIVVLTSYAAHGDMAVAVQAVRDRHSDDFVPKTATRETITARICVAWQYARREAQLRALVSAIPSFISVRAVRVFAEDIGVVQDQCMSRLSRIAQRLEDGDPTSIGDTPALIRSELAETRTAFRSIVQRLHEATGHTKLINVVETVNGVVDCISSTAELDRVDVRVSVSIQPAKLVTFEDDLSAALWEVLRNAIDSLVRSPGVDRRREVEVIVDRSLDGATIRVLDTGVGFPQAVLDNPFKRGQQSAKGSDIGTGLYVAQRMMHTIGGGIAIQNRPQGGAEVILTVRDLGQTI